MFCNTSGLINIATGCGTGWCSQPSELKGFVLASATTAKRGKVPVLLCLDCAPSVQNLHKFMIKVEESLLSVKDRLRLYFAGCYSQEVWVAGFL